MSVEEMRRRQRVAIRQWARAVFNHDAATVTFFNERAHHWMWAIFAATVPGLSQ